LNTLFKKVDTFRNKEIAHFTTETESMTYTELRNIFDDLKDTFIRYTSFETYHNYSTYSYYDDAKIFLLKIGNKFNDIFKEPWLKE
jgi:hypothetical protein